MLLQTFLSRESSEVARLFFSFPVSFFKLRLYCLYCVFCVSDCGVFLGYKVFAAFEGGASIVAGGVLVTKL